MIDPWVHEIARQRHQDLLARAERYRLGRIARNRNTRRQTPSSWLNCAPLAFGMSRLRQAFSSLITTEPTSERGSVPHQGATRDEAVEKYHAIEGGQQTLSNLAAYVTEIVRKGAEG